MASGSTAAGLPAHSRQTKGRLTAMAKGKKKFGSLASEFRCTPINEE
jgi:hypothetical protein